MSLELGDEFTRVSDEVFYSKRSVMAIPGSVIEQLKQIAAKNASGKVRICCHKNTEADVHEMLIVLKNSVRFKPHKHFNKSESFHVIEGRLTVHLYDDEGASTRTIEMGDIASGLSFFYRVDEPIFHTVVPASDFVVFHEVTRGPFNPADTVQADWNEGHHSCPVCAAGEPVIHELRYKTFRHLDFIEFSLTGGKNVVAECRRCSHIFRIFASADNNLLNDLYRSKEYAEHKEEHMVKVGAEGPPQPLAEVQAELIRRDIPKTHSPLKVLDIGCFDGKLLSFLSQKLSLERGVGFDVESRPNFPEGPNFEFISGSLKKVTGKFDLITFSQSLMYIPDLADLFSHIQRLLAPTGMLFFHMPNVAIRPAALLLGDQHHYFTHASLQSLLANFGFASQEIESPFGRDLLFLARKNSGSYAKPAEPALKGILNQLDSLAALVKEFSSRKGVAIFGTTIDAAFVHSLIPGSVSFFVDENEKRIGLSFHLKPVKHPSVLDRDSTCLIPMGKQSEALKARLSSLYKGDFFALDAHGAAGP